MIVGSLKKIYTKYKEVLLYLIFGGLTTLVNILSYMTLIKIVSLNWEVSNIIAWICSVLFAYITNRKYVFESKSHNILKEIINFFSFRLLSFGLDMVLMFLLIDIVKMNNMITKIIVQILVIILNYVFSKLFIFNGKSY